MNSPSTVDSEPEADSLTNSPAERPVLATDVSHPDLITGEAGSYPVEVGVGALGAGAAGAAIGAFAGPIGALIGAAVGAVAGGLAGKEVAESVEESTTKDASAEPLTLAGAAYPAAVDDSPAGDFKVAPIDDANSSAYAPPLIGEVPAESYAPPITVEQIREAAYFHYLGRESRGLPGDALGDWVEAENEVLRA